VGTILHSGKSAIRRRGSSHSPRRGEEKGGGKALPYFTQLWASFAEEERAAGARKEALFAARGRE